MLGLASTSCGIFGPCLDFATCLDYTTITADTGNPETGTDTASTASTASTATTADTGVQACLDFAVTGDTSDTGATSSSSRTVTPSVPSRDEILEQLAADGALPADLVDRLTPSPTADMAQRMNLGHLIRQAKVKEGVGRSKC